MVTAIVAVLVAYVAFPITEYRQQRATARRLSDLGATCHLQDTSWQLGDRLQGIVRKVGLSPYFRRVQLVSSGGMSTLATSTCRT